MEEHVKIGQVWDDREMTLLVLHDLGNEWYKCVVLRIDNPNEWTVQPGELTTLSAFAIKLHGERIA